MVKRRFLCSLLCFSPPPCCAVLALVGANTRFVGANAMFAMFAPRILWIAQRNLWIAPMNAGFAMGILSNPQPPYSVLFFRKPTSPPLPLREGPPLISVFSPQGRRGNRSSSSLVTISFYGWRTIRGLASSGAAFFGMRPHGQRRTKWMQKAQKAHSSTP